MDYQRAVPKIDIYIKLCEHSIALQKAGGLNKVMYWDGVVRGIDEGLPMMERFAQEVDPRLAVQLRAPDEYPAWLHQNKLHACHELRGVIFHQQEIADIVGPQGPQLAASQLHPWVWDHAAKLWSDGHRRAAVQAAATALFDTYIPTKLHRERDIKGGADLVGRAFSIKPPEPGAPRLRFMDIPEGTSEWISTHEGAMKLGQGAAQAIRNLVTHGLAEPDEQEALEMLAVLSYVARLVDKADVITEP
jgi:hypothetical protein